MDETQSRPQERLEELGAGLTQTKRGNIYTLTIIGQIEGHQAQPETIKTTKYEHVLPLLATIEDVFLGKGFPHRFGVFKKQPPIPVKEHNQGGPHRLLRRTHNSFPPLSLLVFVIPASFFTTSPSARQ